MDNLENIQKSLQEINEMIVLMGSHEEEAPIQKAPDGERKHLFYILLAFLAGIGIAVFIAYYYFASTARIEILNKFNEEELPGIKQEIMSAMEKKALGTLPEVQSKLESRLNDRLELLVKRQDSQNDVPVHSSGKSPNQKSVTPIRSPALDARHAEDGEIQQGWSLYGILLDKNWTFRLFDLADAQDPDLLPSPAVTIVTRNYVNIRNDIPSYSPDNGWNYAAASVIGDLKKSEQAIVNQVSSIDTLRGKFVWVKLSRVQP